MITSGIYVILYLLVGLMLIKPVFEWMEQIEIIDLQHDDLITLEVWMMLVFMLWPAFIIERFALIIIQSIAELRRNKNMDKKNINKRICERGRWQMYKTYYRCSVCKSSDAFGLSNFCKNCGADMREWLRDEQ